MKKRGRRAFELAAKRRVRDEGAQKEEDCGYKYNILYEKGEGFRPEKSHTLIAMLKLVWQVAILAAATAMRCLDHRVVACSVREPFLFGRVSE